MTEDPFLNAVNRWPREVRDRVDARKQWQRERARCGSALEFEDRVNRWLDYWASLPPDHDDVRLVWGMTKWLRNLSWQDDPPAPAPEPELPYWYTHPEVDLEGNELDPETGERIGR